MSKCLIALRTVFVAARTVYVLHVKSKAIKSLGLKTSAGSMTLSLRRPLAGSGLHFPSHRISWRRQKKDTLELFTSSFPSSTRRGHFSPCAHDCYGPSLGPSLAHPTMTFNQSPYLLQKELGKMVSEVSAGICLCD